MDIRKLLLAAGTLAIMTHSADAGATAIPAKNNRQQANQNMSGSTDSFRSDFDSQLDDSDDAGSDSYSG